MMTTEERMVTVATALRPDTRDRVTELARAAETTFSNYIRKLIERHVERVAKPEDRKERQAS